MRTERLLLEVELVRNIAHHLLEQAGGLLPRRELHPTCYALVAALALTAAHPAAVAVADAAAVAEPEPEPSSAVAVAVALHHGGLQ